MNEAEFGNNTPWAPHSRAARSSIIPQACRSKHVGSQPIESEKVVVRICALPWRDLSSEDLKDVAWAYYNFSVQFRENLELACELYPADVKLQQLKLEECDTDNLSPWPGIANIGEKINHDEFMRRLLNLSWIDKHKRRRLEEIGRHYLREVRQVDMVVRAASIASYEDGGLERVFTAILQAETWDGPVPHGFKHFLIEHIRFDNDAERGHGALSRHLGLDDKILPLWRAFEYLLTESVPSLTYNFNNAVWPDNRNKL
jgi:hypothetical protein